MAILLATILLLINTTGLIIFIIYLMLKAFFQKFSFYTCSRKFNVNFSFFNVLFFDIKVVEKFSYEYIKIVFDLKIIGIKYLLGSINYLNLYFGNDIYLGFTDDFFSNMIASIGILGFLIFIIIVIYHINFNNLYVFPLILILIGSLHYQTIFTPSGIILFAYILNNSKEKSFLK